MSGRSNKTAVTISLRQVEIFNFARPQLESLLQEIRELSKKKPDDAVNKFKLGFINEKLDEANEILGVDFKPLKTFERFDIDSLPSNSDVVLILSQYMGALERWRKAHTFQDDLFSWYWNTKPPVSMG
jgi:hypothetical protein